VVIGAGALAGLLAGALAVGCSGCSAATPGTTGGNVSSQGTASPVSYQGYSGTAVVSVDGKTILVGPYMSGGCQATVTAVAREGAARVALYLQAVPKPGGCPHGQDEAPPVGAQEIRLAQPLGGRKLVNGATGAAIAWLSARLMLRPAALPAGYRLTGVAPAVTSSKVAGVYQAYSLPHGADPLEIAQSAGSPQVPGPGPGGWTTIRVRGLSGRATRNAITWQEHGLTDFIVVGGLAGPAESQLMTTRQLIAIADSSPAYNTAPLPPVK
jgi:hypothetical protein